LFAITVPRSETIIVSATSMYVVYLS